MAPNINARLKRTQRGQSEVQQKSHALTQGERLILVLVDGVTTTEQVGRKLRGMGERRFKLAIADLMAKGFVEETVPAPDDRAEVLELEIVENYVRHDSLDPVSISSITLQPQHWAANPKTDEVPKVPDDADDGQTGGVDFYLPLEVQAPTAQAAPVFQVASASNLITANGADQREATSARRMKRARRSRRIQIGYWLLFAGLVCAILVVVMLQSR